MWLDHILPDSSYNSLISSSSAVNLGTQLDIFVQVPQVHMPGRHGTRWQAMASDGNQHSAAEQSPSLNAALRHPWMRNMLDESDAIGRHRPGSNWIKKGWGWSATVTGHVYPVARLKCWSLSILCINFYHSSFDQVGCNGLLKCHNATDVWQVT